MEPSKGGNNRALFAQLKNLEKDWEIFSKQSASNPATDLRRCSTGSPDSIFSSFLEMESSPRSLISSLQNRGSPSDHGFINWDVRASNFAVEEIIRDRRDAIRSGKLKGKKLLAAFEEATEVNLQWENDEETICSDCLDLVQERAELQKLFSSSSLTENSPLKNTELSTENHKRKLSIGSCSGSVHSPSEVNQTLEEAKREDKLKVNGWSGNWRRDGVGRSRRIMHAMAWFAFVSILFTFILISITCDGKSVHQRMVRYELVPT